MRRPLFPLSAPKAACPLLADCVEKLGVEVVVLI
jgi:hypothetical protein